MNAEGELIVRVQLRGDTVESVRVESTRPHIAQKLLGGQPVDAALARVPALFSICGRAQAAAARLAVAAARGTTARIGGPRGTSALGGAAPIEFDIAQDYLWRALIDWRRAAGGEPDAATLAGARAALAAGDAAALRTVVEREVLDGPAGDWLGMHLPAFEIWIARAATPAARLLAEVQRDGPRHGAGTVPLLLAPNDPAQLRSVVDALGQDPRFERLPHVDGQPAETGALARLRAHPLVRALRESYGNSTLVRLVARVAELARIAAGQPAGEPLAGAQPLGPGAGLGWVETARGLLIHAAELDGERVRHWRIVAPTEWNFHPRGPLAAGLVGAHAPAGDLRRRAEWLVAALDPCVACRIEFAGAAGA